MTRTSDPNDRASDYEEMARQSAMQTSRKPEGPKATGRCLHCGDAKYTVLGKRWCDANCRDAWEKEQ